MTEDYRSMANQQQQQHETAKKLSVKDLLEKGAGKRIDFFRQTCFIFLISLSL